MSFYPSVLLYEVGLNSFFKGFFIQQYLVHQYLLGAYYVLKMMVESKTKFLLMELTF